MIQIPTFAEKKDLFAWLKLNKDLIIAEKKSVAKFADAVSFPAFTVNTKGQVEKAMANPDVLNMPEFSVDVVINTTNLYDSHGDVHIDGLWNKSLKENKSLYHLQEHQMRFDKVISDRVTATTRKMSWSEIGEDYPGETEALVFHSTIEKARNEYMADQYAKGYVKNHSVGMRYVKIEMAINSEAKWDQEEKAVWDKYYPRIANKAEVDEIGYFWAVTEAKLIEGSAVLMGSNFATPTISINSGKSLESAGETTDPKPTDAEMIINLIKSL